MSMEELFCAIPKSDVKLGRIQTNKTRATADVSVRNVNVQFHDQKAKGKKRCSARTADAGCLAKAIQKNIVALVNNMPFNESSIPDELIADGCITEDECKLVREKRERKDQVRKIVNLVKGRSFTTIKKFLKVVGKENNCPTIVGEIMGHYHELLKTNFIGEKCCGVCKIKTHVNVKYVMDILWQETAISDPLYEQLCDTENVTGQQGQLWDLVLVECNENKKLDILLVALEYKGHYSHIAKELRGQSGLGKGTRCACLGQIDICSENFDSLDSITTYLPNSSSSNSGSSLNLTSDDRIVQEETLEKRSIPNGDVTQSEQMQLIPNDKGANEKDETDVQRFERDTCSLFCCFPFSKSSNIGGGNKGYKKQRMTSCTNHNSEIK